MAQHKNLLEVDLHETKGASTAPANSVHTANGSGVTSWAKIGPDNINLTTVKNINTVVLSVSIDEPNGTFTTYVPLPVAATLVGVIGAIDGLPSATLNVGVYNDATPLATLTFATSGTLPLVHTPVVSGTGASFSAGQCVKILNSSSVASSGKLKITLTFTI